MDTLSFPLNSTSCAIFKHFFDCLVLLAGTNKKDGHLQLLQNVVKWLPKCIEGTQKLLEEEDGGTGREGEESGKYDVGSDVRTNREESLSPINCLFLYLSQLTTAVQFSCNAPVYTEKRSTAGEEDVLFDAEENEEDGDEGGVAISGGGADEEDSTIDESVRNAH